MSDVQRYPLSWPTGWNRTRRQDRKPARFEKHRREWRSYRNPNDPSSGYYSTSRSDLSVADAVTRLARELGRLGVLDGDWLISSNVRVRLDGLPYSNDRPPEDPGVAVYFRLGHERKPRVLACDKWTRVADNIAAIAAHVEAIRAIDRYGVGTLEQAFAGYTALPANTAARWRDVFGFPDDQTVTPDMLDEKFKALAREAHPDAGGTHEQMARLSEARQYARKELGATGG